MPSYDPGNSRHIINALTGGNLTRNNYCPKCDRPGIVSGTDEYYGKIYSCKCFPASWVISPGTGEKVEGIR
ncbi:hypothetical protein [Chlorogloea sp. CCALA 695]|uniref:hypothetical protein n=1 Tax=Chlorogloea sp. CCALA 695 TaxID=2107693 RepID=UPI000D079854|nr:hypothetical protein [Chlorogloea sp. CCALA 695]PSB29610.1 hypothetical protein C7B70_18150 [Chlorogloea sp. CCALA 695]